MSTSFHPQMDGQTKYANYSVGQMLRSIVWPDQWNWVNQLDMTGFTINASVSETTKFALSKLNEGYMSSMLREIRSDSVIPRSIKDFAAQAWQNLATAHNAIIEAHVL